jgi:hypothetical protein
MDVKPRLSADPDERIDDLSQGHLFSPFASKGINTR